MMTQPLTCDTLPRSAWQMDAITLLNPEPNPATPSPWLALVGHPFLQQTNLMTPQQCAPWGLARVWYGRYVAAGVALPYPPPDGPAKVFEAAQLRLKGITLTGQALAPEQTAALVRHLLQRLGLPKPLLTSSWSGT
jgi:hypothetical protein